MLEIVTVARVLVNGKSMVLQNNSCLMKETFKNYREKQNQNYYDSMTQKIP